MINDKGSESLTELEQQQIKIIKDNARLYKEVMALRKWKADVLKLIEDKIV